MFKYIKNLNGFQGTPEIIEIPTESHLEIPIGTLGSLFENEISFFNGGSKTGSFITVEPKTSNDKKTKLKVIRTLPGMVFEAPLIITSMDDPIAVGKHISSRAHGSTFHNYLSNDPGEFIEIVSVDGYEETEKILVTFI